MLKSVSPYFLNAFAAIGIFLCLLLAPAGARAQVKIGDNPEEIHPEALFELESTDRGFLIPRMSTDQRDNAFSIDDTSVGMVIYNTTMQRLQILKELPTPDGKNVIKSWDTYTPSTVGMEAQRPEAPQMGDLYYNTEMQQLEVYTEDGWMVLEGQISRTTRPENPSTGDLYYDTESQQMEVFNGDHWDALMEDARERPDPASEGDLYYNPDTQILELYAGDQWVGLANLNDLQGLGTGQVSSALHFENGYLSWGQESPTYDMNQWWTLRYNQVAPPQTPSVSSGNSINDADGDTSVTVEAATDEDQIRFRTRGAQRMRITEAGRAEIAGSLEVGDTLALDGHLRDRENSIGQPGYVLSSTPSGTEWIPTGISAPILEKDNDYNAQITDGTILVTPSNNRDITIRLPIPSDEDVGKRLTVKRNGRYSANGDTLKIISTAPMDGTTRLNLNLSYQGYTFQALQGSWHIIERF